MPFWKLDQPQSLADIPGALDVSRLAGIVRRRKSVKPSSAPIFASLTEMSIFRQQLTVPVTGLVKFEWQVDCEHTAFNSGPPYGTEYPIGLGGYICWRRVVTGQPMEGAFTWLSASVGANNLRDREFQHYQTIGNVYSDMTVEAGYTYEFSLGLTGHTSVGLAAGVNGIARITPNGGDNFVAFEYWPGHSPAT